MRWTDDTQMSLDQIESLLAHGAVHQDDLAKRFAASYRWSRGYGPSTAKVLRRLASGADWRWVNTSIHPAGSFGNGAAMRAPVLGLYFAHRSDGLDEAVRRASVVTHSHPHGVEGAILIARATAAAALGARSDVVFQSAASAAVSPQFVHRLQKAGEWLSSGREVSASDVARELGNGMEATASCVTAVYLAARFLHATLDDLIASVVSVGGDADTIGAMACAIWGAARGDGDLPGDVLEQLEDRARISALAEALHRRVLEC